MLLIKVHNRDEETGEMQVAGSLNSKEVSFLLQFAINQLMANGVLFDLTKPETEDGEDSMRIKIPEGVPVH